MTWQGGAWILAVVGGLGLSACNAQAGLSQGRARSEGCGVAPGGITHWSAQWCFVDAFKQSLPWRSSDGDRPLELDERGWVKRLAPGQQAWSLMYAEAAPHYPGGPYVARYRGRGELRFSGAARVVQSAPGRILLEVDPARGGLRVDLLATDPNDYLRDLEILPASFEQAARDQPFHPRFLELLRGFDVIRFAHLMQCGGDGPRTWEARITPAHQTQAGPKGIALEYAIALCNRLDADAWFTMPVNSNPAYFRAFAQAVRDGLEPHRRVYVEYGDDVGVWPTRSSQYCIHQGLRLGLSEDWGQARSRYYARRSAELFAIWNEVFGDDERRITVLNPIDEEACTYADAAQGADAGGVVTIFGQEFGKLPNVDHLLGTDLETLMDELEEDAHVSPKVIDTITRARRFGLQPVSFYMTPIICPLGPIAEQRGPEVQAQVEARTVGMLTHPRMESIFRQYIRSWREAGGGLWIHNGLVAAPTRWGWFALLQHMDEDPAGSPKFRAVQAARDLDRAAQRAQSAQTRPTGSPPGDGAPFPEERTTIPANGASVPMMEKASNLSPAIPLQTNTAEKAADPVMGSAAGWTVRLDIDGYFPDEGILVSTTSPDFWQQGPGAFITKPPYLNGQERQKYHRVYIRPTGEDWTKQRVTVVPDASGKLTLTCYAVAPGALNIVHWDQVRVEGASLANGSFERIDDHGDPVGWRLGGWGSDAPRGEVVTDADSAADGHRYVTSSWTWHWSATITDVVKDRPIILRWKSRFVPPETRYPVRVGLSGLGEGGPESHTRFHVARGMETDTDTPERYVRRLLDGFEAAETFGGHRAVNEALAVYLAEAGTRWGDRTIELMPQTDGSIEITLHAARIRDTDRGVYVPVLVDYADLRVEGASLENPGLEDADGVWVPRGWARIGADARHRLLYREEDRAFARTWYQAGLRARLTNVRAGRPVRIHLRARRVQASAGPLAPPEPLNR